MHYRIRKAVLRDSAKLVEVADELIHLDDRSRREAVLNESFRDPNCFIYVADVDNETVGFVEACVFPDFVEGERIAIILNLIVKEGYRRSGIGSGLIQTALQEAESREAAEIHVWTLFDNKQAIGFYTKQGFTKGALLLEKETPRIGKEGGLQS